ncbi:hypothetical protein N7448_002698 [Penicillium atrosanguineum]|uniref:Uncharacterized protein n=1 Tax=Penicillium atrosanguineum TaxID=1132637 RepID=A0A9W9PUT8_9EURO|nr:uncharacterized protein N7443_006104 [Penicillium atrosanguineum]KAJ5128988.1 hypothetical protein N7526_007154 [Penicillium atrosanguineum]KAJ5145306.1 hypothetical protein N7448_002698 [Penicillium atrosanguineum]KAJ5301102.1 hypothetical protein N7443_006104 [Penicillium atrosanguineum]KAJ5311745.1 hypothetical protein N7476_007605 [Penicillium atrosanguineum]
MTTPPPAHVDLETQQHAFVRKHLHPHRPVWTHARAEYFLRPSTTNHKCRRKVRKNQSIGSAMPGGFIGNLGRDAPPISSAELSAMKRSYNCLRCGKFGVECPHQDPRHLVSPTKDVASEAATPSNVPQIGSPAKDH